MSVGEDSVHLQLINFWPSHAPRKEVCGRAKIFGQLAVFVSPLRAFSWFDCSIFGNLYDFIS